MALFQTTPKLKRYWVLIAGCSYHLTMTNGILSWTCSCLGYEATQHLISNACVMNSYCSSPYAYSKPDISFILLSFSCGYFGKSNLTCLAKGCCWDDNADHAVETRCYMRNGESSAANLNLVYFPNIYFELSGTLGRTQVGGVGVKPPLELDILQKSYYLHKEINCFRILFAC